MEPKGIYGDGGGSSQTVIRQNTAKMAQVAAALEDYASDFDQKKKEFFDILEARITATESSEASAWWGPNAMSFLEECRNTDTDFQDAKQNILAYSDNMVDQAQNWVKFEKI